jgi:hypothetical protein
MENFTIHIFGYGETQINSNEFSVKVATESLSTVPNLIADIWAKKPIDSNAEEKYHVIHIFGHEDIRWLSKDGFSLERDASFKQKIDLLIAELKTAFDKLPAEPKTQLL